MLARALLTAELGCALTPAFSDDIDHSGCFSSPSLASAKGGCDYSRKCHTGVIRSAFGLSPSPAGRWCTDSLSAFWIPDSTGAKSVYSHSWDVLGSCRATTKLWNVCSRQWLCPSGFETDIFPSGFLLLCNCFHFILYVGKGKTD